MLIDQLTDAIYLSTLDGTFTGCKPGAAGNAGLFIQGTDAAMVSAIYAHPMTAGTCFQQLIDKSSRL